MKNTRMLRALIISLCALFAVSSHAMAGQTVWTGAANSTNWFAAANWSAGVPTAADDAIVPVVANGAYPWIANGQATCASLTVRRNAWTVLLADSLNAGSITNHGLLGVAGGALTVSTSFATGGTGAQFIIIGGTVLVADGATTGMILGDANGGASTATIMGGFVLTSNLTAHPGSSISVSGSGILAATRNWTTSSGSFQQSGGIVGVLGAAPATVSLPDTALNFWIYKQAGTSATLAAPLTVTQELVLQEGVLNSGSGNHDITATNDMYLTTGLLQLNAATLRIGRNVILGTGHLDPGSGTVIYNGAGPQAIAPLDYFDLLVDKPNAAATLTGSALSSNTLTVAQGSLIASQSTLTIFDTLTVLAGSAAEFLDSELYLGDATTYGTISAAGELRFLGSSWNSRSAVRATDPNKPWSGSVSGVLECEYFEFSDIAGASLDCSGATIRSLRLGTFASTEQAGVLLTLGAGTQFDPSTVWQGPNGPEAIFNGLEFLGDTGGALANVHAPGATAHPVTMTYSAGPLSGPHFENDSTDSVHWSATKIGFEKPDSVIVEGNLAQIAVLLEGHPSPLAPFPRDLTLQVISPNSNTAVAGVDHAPIPSTLPVAQGSFPGTIATLLIPTTEDTVLETLDVVDLHLQTAVGSWTGAVTGIRDHRLWLSDDDSDRLFGASSASGNAKVFRIRAQSPWSFRCSQWEATLNSVQSLTYDENHDIYYALSLYSQELVTINPYTGSVAVVAGVHGNVLSIAYDSTRDLLYFISQDASLPGSNELQTYDIATGVFTYVGGLPNQIIPKLLTYDPVHDLLFSAMPVGLFQTHHLISILPQSAAATTVGPLNVNGITLSSFAYNRHLDVIHATYDGTIFQESWYITPSTGAATPLGYFDTDALGSIAYNANEQQVYGLRPGYGDFLRVNVAAGTTERIGWTLKGQMLCLAGDPSGTGAVYGARALAGLINQPGSAVVRFDNTSGKPMDVFSCEDRSFRSLAQVSSQQALYAYDHIAGCVVKIDLASGQLQALASTPYLYSMEYVAATDTLYAVGHVSTNVNGLMTVDLGSGVATLIAPFPLPAGAEQISSIAYDTIQGTMVGVSLTKWHSIDLTTAATTVLGVNEWTSSPRIAFDTAQQRLLLIDGTSKLWSVSPSALAGAPVALPYEDYADMESLAYDPVADCFYTVSQKSDLVKIHPDTGEGTIVGRIFGNTPEQIRGIEFDAGMNRLIAVGQNGGLSNQNPVYSIDPVGGQGILLGYTPMTLNGIALDAAQQIYYVTSGYSLYTLNVSTAALTLIGSHNLPTGIANYIEGLAWDPTAGKLLGSANGKVYDINVATGNATLHFALKGSAAKGLAYR